MDSLLPFLTRAAHAVGETSWQAIPIVVVILCAQATLKRVLPAQSLCNLWLILVAHLVLPFTPQSPISLFGWLPEANWYQVRESRITDLMSAAAGELIHPADAEAWALPITQARNEGTASSVLVWAVDHPLVALWLAGALAMSTALLGSSLLYELRLRPFKPVEDKDTKTLLDDCRRATGVRTRVILAESRQARSPEILGFLRPRLLLPEGLAGRLSREELRHIFLHEMAHLRRRDIPVAWLMSGLLVLHWFNPFVWIACLRLRSDREVACDAFVLGNDSGVSPLSYGRTMIALIEQCQRPALFPNSAGILENKNQMTRRITMIAKYEKIPVWQTVLSAGVCLALATVLLSRPLTGKAFPASAGGEEAVQIVTTTNAKGHLEDSVDLPFVLDQRVIGTWRSVAFVESPDKFDPSRQVDNLYLKELAFHTDGSTNLAFNWTKDYVLHRSDKTAARYDLVTLSSGTYMFLEWKSGDYTIRHKQPKFYVLRKTSDTPAPKPERLIDEVDFPFVNDNSVVGRWVSVDFVDSPEKFVVGKQSWKGDLYLKELQFHAMGTMTPTAFRWTEGKVIHEKAKTAASYQIREIGGDTYLFMEWKSGDYTLRHMKPKYYVLRKAA